MRMSSDEEAEVIERIRARIGGNLMEDLEAAAASPGREKLLKSPPKKTVARDPDGLEADRAEMERQQNEHLSAIASKEASEPPAIAGEGEVQSSASKRYAKSMKRPDGRATTDYHPVDGHSTHAVFGTAGRFAPKDVQVEKGKENRTLGADVSSIEEVTGVDAWLSKRGPVSASPVPEEEPEPDTKSRALTRGPSSARKKEIYAPKPMERHPTETKVYAATFNTVARGDVFAQEKHARHGSIHQRPHLDEFHATYKPDRPGPGWSNVRWSAESSQLLGDSRSGRAQQRDLYGQTEEDKEAQRRRMEQAQREYEEQRRVQNTPRWETDKNWKMGIRPVPAPKEAKPPREPPTVQLSPKMAFGRKEAGQSSPFLSKGREDLFHHNTSGSPRPGQLHTSDANESLPLRGKIPTHSIQKMGRRGSPYNTQ